MPNRLLNYSIMLCLCVLSCDSNRVFDKYKSLPNSWHKDSIIWFNFNTTTHKQHHNLYINLRSNNSYKYNNLFLIAITKYPNGKTIQDTLEYKMANPDGSMLGTGFSDIKTHKLWYKGYDKPFLFNEDGNYTFSIQHAMRDNQSTQGIVNLEGITEVGFRIENQIKQ